MTGDVFADLVGHGVASMRPRLIAVDDREVLRRNLVPNEASMRPRLIAVDDQTKDKTQRTAATASMRPRLIAVDDF